MRRGQFRCGRRVLLCTAWEFGTCHQRESARKRAPLTNSDAAILSLVAATAAAALSLRLVDDDDKEKRGERGEKGRERERERERSIFTKF